MLLWMLLSACGRGREAPADCDPELGLAASEQPAADDTLRLRLELERCPGEERCFELLGWREDLSGRPLDGGVLSLSADGGSLGLAEHTGVVTRALLEPERDGELAVRVSDPERGLSLRRTALVLDRVAERWGQPMVVEGLVNTCGWEDGAALSPDGQHLLVQYLPVPIDCLLRPGRRYCRAAIGPVSGPARPDMPGAERVDEEGHIHHGCPTTGLDPMPFPVPPNALYGFTRQEDGSYAEPFVLGLEGLDGCVAPWGPSFLPGDSPETGRLVVALDDPYDDPASVPEATEITLGAPLTLATWEKVDGNAERTSSLLAPLGLTREGQNGNPHLEDGGGRLWFDDEVDAHAIFVTELDAEGGATGPITQLPTAVFEGDESQPFFTGAQLFYRQTLTLMASDYLGGELGDPASWSTPEVQLGVADSGEAGAIAGVGEPTIATIGEQELLNFVYVVRREDGTLDVNVAQVSAR
ncbi:MAG: hypothetical protein H6741_05220 [Alphaproteobacteria bacterium]|nr:hypothetical protein [Alphaproteobacteria bacterium]MCB9792107.1 hypothetical protein [Alphaproteobacteria bacterium]